MTLIDLLTGAFKARISKLIAKTLGIPNFDQLDDNLWFGGLNPVTLIVKHDFKRVLDLRDEAETDYGSRLNQNGVEYNNAKILDTHGITATELDNLVKWIQSSDEKTLIHCNLGRGRAAMVSIAYLLKNEYNLDDAIEYTRKRRSVMYVNMNQRHSLHSYIEFLGEKK